MGNSVRGDAKVEIVDTQLEYLHILGPKQGSNFEYIHAERIAEPAGTASILRSVLTVQWIQRPALD